MKGDKKKMPEEETVEQRDAAKKEACGAAVREENEQDAPENAENGESGEACEACEAGGEGAAGEKAGILTEEESGENAEAGAGEEKKPDGDRSGPEKKKSFFSKKQENTEHKKTLEELEALKKANEALQDRYMRLAAEYENYKRRTAKEMETKYVDVKGDTLKNVLPILDNFERALKTEVPVGCEAYSTGIQLIYNQLLAMLAAQQVEEIPSLGETFDPQLHHAVMHIEDENLGENTVAEVFEKGYRMGDKVLRYSMVKVAN